MVNNNYDLHIHSNISLDANTAPEEIVSLAHEKWLCGIALTDHNNVAGIPAAMKAGAALGFEVIPGVETEAKCRGTIAHIIGLFIDIEEPSLLEYLAEIRTRYTINNQLIIGVLIGKGLPLTMEHIAYLVELDNWAPPVHIKYLEEQGLIDDYSPEQKEQLRSFLWNRPNYLCHKSAGAEEVIARVHKAGGLAILAHPFGYRLPLPEIESMLAEMKSFGLDGVEVYYYTHTIEQQSALKALAEKYDLLISGGSDFHGYERQDSRDIGKGLHCTLAPNEEVENMKSKLGKRLPKTN